MEWKEIVLKQTGESSYRQGRSNS